MVAVSDLAAIWMFGKKANYKVINNGLNVAKYRYNELSRYRIRKEFGLEDELVIIHVGAMRKQKNHMFLLDIFSEILKRQKNSKLVLVGDGKLKPNILNKVNRLKIEDSVIFAGNRNDVQDILSAADVFLFPSFYEGFPNAVLEAQTAGLPCLISDVITKEVIVNENCKTMSLSASAKEWAIKLLSLSSFKDRRIGAKNVKLKGFAVEDEVKKIEDLYRTLLLNQGLS